VTCYLKTEKMPVSKINREAWTQLKTQIESHLKDDEMITDVMVNLKIQESKRGDLKNILRINLNLQ